MHDRHCPGRKICFSTKDSSESLTVNNLFGRFIEKTRNVSTHFADIAPGKNLFKLADVAVLVLLHLGYLLPRGAMEAMGLALTVGPKTGDFVVKSVMYFSILVFFPSSLHTHFFLAAVCPCPCPLLSVRAPDEEVRILGRARGR